MYLKTKSPYHDNEIDERVFFTRDNNMKMRSEWTNERTFEPNRSQYTTATLPNLQNEMFVVSSSVFFLVRVWNAAQ